MRNIVTAPANPSAFFQSMFKIFEDWAMAGVDSFVIPIGLIICGGVFIFQLIKLVGEYQESREGINKRLFPMLICLVIAGILITKNLWWSAFVG